jgi:hypothetical protein
MKLHTVLLMALAAVWELRAGAIYDIGGDASAVVHTGDALVFEVSAASFRSDAAALGLSPDPTALTFALMTLPVSGSSSFSATLESGDGSVSAAAPGALTFSGGWISAGGYTGAVSLLQGSWQFSPVLSRQLFSAGSALLTLRNNGPDLLLGLDPYTLRQDLLASLSAGPLSVGAVAGPVELEDAPRAMHFQGLASQANLAPPSATPEPGSGWLFLAGAFLFFALSAALKSLSKPRQSAISRAK